MSKAFWVIETGRTTYWDGKATGDDADFTDNIDRAAKFYDSASAEAVRLYLIDLPGRAPRCRSVEHSYIQP